MTEGQGLAQENTSGQRGAEPPEEVRGRFNWGAFGLGCVWAVAHHVWDGSVLDLVLLGAAWFGTTMIAVAAFSRGPLPGAVLSPAMLGGGIAGLALFLMWRLRLGHHGYALAWRHRRFRDADQYRAVEQAWKGAGILAAVVVFGRAAFYLGLGLVMGYWVGGAGVR